MSQLNFYMVRHAPVVNKAGKIYGDDADVDLDIVSAQLAELAATLPHPDKSMWYSSGIERATVTANAVLARMSLNEDLLNIHQGFREQDFGTLIGRGHDQLDGMASFVDGKLFSPEPPDGETISLLCERVAKAIKEVSNLAVAQKLENIVFFCHGGTIRAAHLYFNNLSLDHFIDLYTPHAVVHRFKSFAEHV